MTIGLDEQIKCVRREIAMRKHVYPRRVEQSKMTQQAANRELETMEAVLATLLAEEAKGRLL